MRSMSCKRFLIVPFFRHKIRNVRYNTENVVMICYFTLPFIFLGVGSCQAYKSFSRILHQGHSWVHLGMLESCLLATQGPVDPAEEYSILLKYAQQEVIERFVYWIGDFISLLHKF